MKILNLLSPKALFVLFAVLLGFSSRASAVEPPNSSMRFNENSNLYDLNVAELNITDNVSVELWVQPDADCPAGAVILDKLGPGTLQGIRLEIGAGGTLRLVSSHPVPIQTEAKLATDKPTHVVAAFDPREKIVAIYMNGALAAKLNIDSKQKIVIIG